MRPIKFIFGVDVLLMSWDTKHGLACYLRQLASAQEQGSTFLSTQDRASTVDLKPHAYAS